LVNTQLLQHISQAQGIGHDKSPEYFGLVKCHAPSRFC
jgi:hypothetical protein